MPPFQLSKLGKFSGVEIVAEVLQGPGPAAFHTLCKPGGLDQPRIQCVLLSQASGSRVGFFMAGADLTSQNCPFKSGVSVLWAWQIGQLIILCSPVSVLLIVKDFEILRLNYSPRVWSQ